MITIQQITEKYLPIMQNLQQSAAGRPGMYMSIRVARTYMWVDITVLGTDDSPIDHISEYFFDCDREERCDENCVKISAFFAAHVMVKPVEAELVSNVSNN